jgi:hypothetical protein
MDDLYRLALDVIRDTHAHQSRINLVALSFPEKPIKAYFADLKSMIPWLGLESHITIDM